MDVSLHRCSFVSLSPSGAVTSAYHPSGHWYTVARENGGVELWLMSGGYQQASGDSDFTRSPWTCVACIPGLATLAVRSVVWAPGAHPASPTSLGGARLFLASLDGGLYEADWEGRVLKRVGDTNGGAAWCLAAFAVPAEGEEGGAEAAAVAGVGGGGGGAGGKGATLLAAGCEDGSVRVWCAPPKGPPTHLVTCPGVTGRVLCVAWHPALPILFSGNAGGLVQGFDFSAQVERVKGWGVGKGGKRRLSGPHLGEGGKKSKRGSAVGGVNRRVEEELEEEDRGGGGGGGEEEEEEEGEAAQALLKGHRGATVGPPPLISFQLAGGGKGRGEKGARDIFPWCCSVSEDFTVAVGDSEGNVTIWNGLSGASMASLPVHRHEGDCLCVSVALEEEGEGGEGEEGGSGSGSGSGRGASTKGREEALVRGASKRPLLLASGGMDGYVKLSSRPSKGGGRWVPMGTRLTHTNDVRTLTMVSGVGRGGGSTLLISGSADGVIAASLVEGLNQRGGGGGGYSGQASSSTTTTNVAPPVRHQQAPRTLTMPHVLALGGYVAVAGQGRILASLNARCLSLWSLTKGGGDGGASPASALLKWEMGLPCTVEEGGGETPLYQPSSLSISSSGHWCAFSTSSGGVRVLHIPPSSSLSPTLVPLPPTTHLSAPVPLMCFVDLPAAPCSLLCLVVKIPGGGHCIKVLLCRVNGEGEATCTLTLSLPLPMGDAIPPSTSQAWKTIKEGGAGDHRDSMGGEEGQGGGEGGGGSYSRRGGAFLPLAITGVARSGESNKAYLALSTGGGLVHVFSVNAGGGGVAGGKGCSGQLKQVINTSPALPTTLAFSRNGKTLFWWAPCHGKGVQGGLRAVDPLTGQSAVWEGALEGKGAHARSIAGEGKGGNITSIIVLTPADATVPLEPGSLGVKLLLCGGQHLAPITFLAPKGGEGGGQGGKGKDGGGGPSYPSPVFANIVAAGLLGGWEEGGGEEGGGGGKSKGGSGKRRHSEGGEGGGSSSSSSSSSSGGPSPIEVVLVEAPRSLVASTSVAPLSRKKYGVGWR